jgi:hypothetical protein
LNAVAETYCLDDFVVDQLDFCYNAFVGRDGKENTKVEWLSDDDVVEQCERRQFKAFGRKIMK